MQLFRYINYFRYLVANQNFSIAWHIIRDEISGEKKYGIKTTGVDELMSLEEKGVDISHASIYMPASYEVLEIVFNALAKKKFNHFLDIGCGKGRAMCVAAHFGCEYITGVDFSKNLCSIAEQNLDIISRKFPALYFQVYNNDAFYFDIEADVDCIFLFNPFDEMIMSGVVENIIISLENDPRELFLIYLNPIDVKLFTDIGFIEIFRIDKLNYMDGTILKYTPR